MSTWFARRRTIQCRCRHTISCHRLLRYSRQTSWKYSVLDHHPRGSLLPNPIPFDPIQKGWDKLLSHGSLMGQARSKFASMPPMGSFLPATDLVVIPKPPVNGFATAPHSIYKTSRRDCH